MVKYILLSIVFSFSVLAQAKRHQVRWVKSIAPQTNTKFSLTYYSGLQPIIYNSAVIIASSSGHISSFNQKTAWRNWTKKISSESFYFSVLYKNILFLGSLSGNLIAFDLIKQNIIWKKKLPENSLYKVAIYKKQILLLSEQGQLLSVSTSNSEILWSKKVINQLKKLEIRSATASLLSLRGYRLYIKQASKIVYFNLRAKKVIWTKKYNSRLKQASYFVMSKQSYLLNNRKYRLAGAYLSKTPFFYLYTQGNSLVKIIAK